MPIYSKLAVSETMLSRKEIKNLFIGEQRIAEEDCMLLCLAEKLKIESNRELLERVTSVRLKVE